MFCLSLKKLVNREDPILVASELTGAAKKESIFLNQNSYHIIFGFYDPDDGDGNYFIDPDYFTISATMVVDEELKEAYARSTGGLISLDIKKCEDVMEDPTDFENMYCFRYDATDADTFVQIYDRAHIEIEVLSCDAGPPGNTCHADVRGKIQRSMLYTLTPYYSIDPNDFDEPLKLDYTTSRSPLTFDAAKEMVISLEKIEFISDNGWLVESKETKTGITVENTRTDFHEDSNTLVILNIVIEGSGNKITYNRKYAKIQDVLAEIAGLAGPIFIVLGILIVPYVKVKLQEQLTHEYYDIKTTRGVTSPGKKPSNTKVIAGSGLAKAAMMTPDSSHMKVEMIDSGYASVLQSAPPSPRSAKANQVVPFGNTGDLESPKQEEKLTFGVWIKSFFKTNLRVKMLNETKDILERNVDLLTLNKKMAEIDKIKSLLLTEEQKILFDNLPKPMVLLDIEAKPDSKDAVQIENWADSSEEKEEKLKEAYRAIKNNPNPSVLDQKLLSFYEDKSLE